MAAPLSSKVVRPTPLSDAQAIVELVKLWHATRRWAEELLVEKLRVNSARDVLEAHRGRAQLPDSDWWYRTHGVGVDVFQHGNVGGIDFDFDKPAPDSWCLREFLIKQLNAGAVAKRVYRPLLQDRERWARACHEAMPAA